MACATHLLPLFILIQLYSVAAYNSHGHRNATTSSYCHPDQAASLVQLKQSFIFDYSTTTLPSWQPGTDCCLWEGIRCEDGGGGHVEDLDLGGRGLYSFGLNAALFNLTSLRYLDLSMNDFGGSRIPAAGFERLSKLTHLNLSYSGLYGQIPIAIGKLTSLISLDLSALCDMQSNDIYALFGRCNYLLLQEPSFETLVANFTNLRELYVDGVDISSSGEEWCSGLGKVAPRLQVLSMANCQLNGPIHSSLSSLRYLTVINLEYNLGISGVVPEFFAYFSDLSLLQLRSNSFSGWFPQTIFQLKNIRVLDVSGNMQLSGHVPEFPNGSSLEILDIKDTNFSGIKLSSLSNLLSLRELGFDRGSISVLPTDLLFDRFNSLQTLKLSFVFEWDLGTFLSWIRRLKNLKSLQLSSCYSSQIMPPMIANLTNLTNLEISSCHFFGQIPSSIGNLNKLTSLKILDSSFSGTLPSSIGNLKNLRSLEISYSSLSGLIATEIGLLSKLMVLILRGCRFSGRIPSTIDNLTQLNHVDLSQNDLTGEIPTSLFASPTMVMLDVSSNQLYGPVQDFSRLTSLVSLDLSSNNLTGLVPLDSLRKLRKLRSIGLSHNRLTVLDGEGSTPIVPLLPKLSSLELVSCNLITIPKFLMHVNHISTLDLSSNKIHGTIPKWIWVKWEDSLTFLNLSHNTFTYMQLTSNVLPNSRLLSLDLSFNKLQGQIPMPNSSLDVLDFSNNGFSSLMPNFTAYLSQITYLTLSKNNISGHVPHSICDARNLGVLDLSYNNFGGLIPSCLIEDAHLSVLNLRENHFEGTLPYNVSEKCKFQIIDLHGNNIQGQLPRYLSNCVELEVLDIGNNQIVDTFPSWLGRLSKLHVLVLRSNQFYGSIDYPPRDGRFGKYFSELQILDIASNNFSGKLDPRWFEKLTYMSANFSDTGSILQPMFHGAYYQNTISITYKGQYVRFEKILTSLTVVDFSNNALDGDIPESIGRLVSLHILSMSHNAFTGRIPPQMGEMHQLESLDLSYNKLSGEIPQELTDLTFLGTLNLCKNKLHGRIPQLNQFETFDNTSYEGNPGLCGPPLSKPCGSSSNPNEAQVNISGDHDVILFLFVGVGFGVGFKAGILMNWGKIGKCFQIV